MRTPNRRPRLVRRSSGWLNSDLTTFNYHSGDFMSNRRRLSVERLEDRTNPASLNEQALATYFTTLTLKDMMEHIDHYSWLANPAAGPLVKSFFNNVYQQSQTTLSMFHSSSGLGAALVKPLAQLNASFAKGVGS